MRPFVCGRIHHALIAFLTGHQFRDHCTILLVDCGFVIVNSPALIDAVVRLAPVLARANLRQLDVVDAADTTLLIVGSDLALDAVAGKHRVVQVEPTLWCLALSFVFIVVDTINVDYALVTLTTLPID